MSNVTRRSLLRTSAVGLTAAGAALALAACTTSQVATFEASWSSFATQVQTLVNQGASYIPTLESVAATMAALFGPQWSTAVALTGAVLNQVVSALVSVVNALTPPAATSMRARLRGATKSTPVAIGTLPGTAVVVQGYH